MSKNGKKKDAKDDASSSGEGSSSASSSSDDDSSVEQQTEKPSKNKTSPAKKKPSPAPKKTGPPKNVPKPPPEPKSATALEPPTFSLQDAHGKPLDPERYELWSIRMPALLPVTALDGCQLSIPVTATASIPGGAVASKDDCDKPVTIPNDKGDSFMVRWGNPVENESFRLLVSKPKITESSSMDSDDDGDDNNPNQRLVPTHMPFTRHLNVVSQIDDLVATHVAPGVDRAPSPDPKSALTTSGPFTKLRKAYQPVPQKKGLKRRWMPLGTKGAAEVVADEARPRSLSTSSFTATIVPPAAAAAAAAAAAKKRKMTNDKTTTSSASTPVKRARSTSEESKKKNNNKELSPQKKEKKKETLINIKEENPSSPPTNGEKPVQSEEVLIKSEETKAERKARKALKKEAKKERKSKKAKKEKKNDK